MQRAIAKPYFKHKGITLYQQDCLEGMKEHIRSKTVDVIVTSPPYNIGIRYNSYDDAKSREKYLEWIEELAREAKRVLSDKGSFFLNIGSKPSDPWIPFDVAQILRKHFALQNIIHWIKSIAISKDAGRYPAIIDDTAVGHYKPIRGKRFLNDCHEYIFHFTKRGDVEIDRLAIGVPYQDKSNVGRWMSSKEDKRCRGNTWFIPYETIHDKRQRPHPSTFPVKLPEMCVKLHGLDKAKLVLDPLMGVGSTAVACHSLGVSCIGFELDKEYLEFAVQRIRSI